MSYRGDIALGSTIDLKFTTRRFTTGVPFTLAGTPSVAAYVGNGTTEITAGITLSVDFDSRTGLNNVNIVATSGNGFAAGTNVDIVITAGTVDSVSVVGEVVGSFSIDNRSGLRPTTAGRTLDVSAGGEAGVDWANVGGQSTSVNLSATTTNVVNTATAVTTVNGLANNVITASSINADAITAAKVAADVSTEFATTLLGTTSSLAGTSANTVGRMIFKAGSAYHGEDTAQGGTASTITLSASASAVNNCDPGQVFIIGGTGVGQAREITNYNTTTKVATVARDFRVTPDNTSIYMLGSVGAVLHTNEGIAQAGSTTTITLNSTAPSGNDSIVGQTVWVTSGAGADQVAVISAYNGTTKIATFATPVITAFDNTSNYMLLPFGPSFPVGGLVDTVDNITNAVEVGSLSSGGVTAMEDAVWDAVMANHLDSGSTGAALNSAGSAGDPWGTTLPGAYGAGTAGFIVGTNINATVSSRATQTSVDTLDDFVDTEVSAIKAVTDKLDTALVQDGAVYQYTANALELAPSGGLDAAGVRAAIGLASANLDTQLSGINTNVDAVPGEVWTQTLEGAFTAVQLMRGISASTMGELSGASTTNVLIRDISDTKSRINATVDVDGNRTAVTYDLT